MRKLGRLFFSLCLGLVFIFNVTPHAFAAKTGTSCKKLNAKNWDGEIPIVCAKKNGKLIWTKFSTAKSSPTPTPTPTPSEKTNNLVITLIGISSTLSTKDLEGAMLICRTGIYKYPDLNSKTGVEVRDSSGSIVGISNLGEPTVLDNVGSSLGNCIFKTNISLKKSDFYQIKIGKRYDSTYSYAELDSKMWQISLTIGL